MSTSRENSETLQASLAQQREQWLKGYRVRPEDLTANICDEQTRRNVLLELIHNEVILREESGELPTLAEYQQRYPEHSEDLRIQWTLDLTMMGEAEDLHSPVSAGVRRIGRYELREVLGRGGMGIVYKAWDPELNRWVAVKRIRSGIDASEEEKSRLRLEAEAIGRIPHEQIVRVFDTGAIADLPWFAMEFCDSGSLTTLLSNVPLPAREAAALMAKLADGLSVSHQHQVVHRDLKPSNILLSGRVSQLRQGVDAADLRNQLPTLVPKISDFGLARLTDRTSDRTQTGAAVGTPAYMSPELAKGQREEIGPATDIYSLGAILYECLTGRPAFRADSTQETIRQVIEEDPAPPMQLNRSVPRDLNNITLKCLEKNPSARYYSAAELRDDLQRFLDGKPVQARPVSSLVQIWKWSKRHPASAASLTIAATALLVIIAGRENYLRQVQESRDDALKAQAKAEQLRAQADENARLAEQNAVLARSSAQQAEELRVEAERQLVRAERNSEWAMEAVDSLLQKISDQSLNSIPGLVLVRQQILEEALKQCARFLEDRGPGDKAARYARALALQRAGRIHRQLAKRDEALAEFTEARDVCQQLVAEFPDDVRFARELGKSAYQRAISKNPPGGITGGSQDFEEVLALWNTMLQQFPDDPDLLIGKAKSLSGLAPRYRVSGDSAKSEATYQEVLAILDGLKSGQPDNIDVLRTEATAAGNFAALYGLTARQELAEQMQLRACTTIDRALELDPADIANLHLQITGIKRLAAIRFQIPGRERQVAEDFERCSAIAQKLALEQPLIMMFQFEAADAILNLSNSRNRLGQSREAIEAADRGIAISERYRRILPEDTRMLAILGKLLCTKGEAAFRISPAPEAKRDVEAGADLLKSIPGTDSNPELQAEVLMSWAKVAATRTNEELVKTDFGPVMNDVRKALEKFPGHPLLIRSYHAIGQFVWLQFLLNAKNSEAAQFAREALKLADEKEQIVWAVREAHAMALTGAHREAIERIRGMISVPAGGEYDPHSILTVYALAANAARMDAALSTDDRSGVAETYLRTAEEVFRQQVAAGAFAIAVRLDRLLSAVELAEFRSRAPVVDVLRGLSAK